MTNPSDQQAAEEYASSKVPKNASALTWHRLNNSFLAGIAHNRLKAEKLVEACVRMKFVIEGGRPRPPLTADKIDKAFIKALAEYRGEK